MFETTIALILFLFPLAYSPGRGTFSSPQTVRVFRFRATLPSNIGYHLATWIVTAAIGFGFLATMERYPQLFATLKVAGAVYVLYLAWKMLRAGAMDASEQAKPATFVDGVALLVLNPKAYVIIALMFTQFLGQSSMNLFGSVMLITTVFTLNNLIAFSVWALVGDQIAVYFRSPKSARLLNLTFGSILAAVAIWILFS